MNYSNSDGYFEYNFWRIGQILAEVAWLREWCYPERFDVPRVIRAISAIINRILFDRRSEPRWSALKWKAKT